MFPFLIGTVRTDIWNVGIVTAFVYVSIPHRYGKNLKAAVYTPSTRTFPFLIGTVRTENRGVVEYWKVESFHSS